mmetsp:Transcript_12671/g.28459  ORF Transcript_12671/g.28459 Transcript_12671/m.28459 type:complete len:818 (+) Transcript_12671:107-2560(+)
MLCSAAIRSVEVSVIVASSNDDSYSGVYAEGDTPIRKSVSTSPPTKVSERSRTSFRPTARQVVAERLASNPPSDEDECDAESSLTSEEVYVGTPQMFTPSGMVAAQLPTAVRVQDGPVVGLSRHAYHLQGPRIEDGSFGVSCALLRDGCTTTTEKGDSSWRWQQGKDVFAPGSAFAWLPEPVQLPPEVQVHVEKAEQESATADVARRTTTRVLSALGSLTEPCNGGVEIAKEVESVTFAFDAENTKVEVATYMQEMQQSSPPLRRIASGSLDYSPRVRLARPDGGLCVDRSISEMRGCQSHLEGFRPVEAKASMSEPLLPPSAARCLLDESWREPLTYSDLLAGSNMKISPDIAPEDLACHHSRPGPRHVRVRHEDAEPAATKSMEEAALDSLLDELAQLGVDFSRDIAIRRMQLQIEAEAGERQRAPRTSREQRGHRGEQRRQREEPVLEVIEPATSESDSHPLEVVHGQGLEGLFEAESPNPDDTAVPEEELLPRIPASRFAMQGLDPAATDPGPARCRPPDDPSVWAPPECTDWPLFEADEVLERLAFADTPEEAIKESSRDVEVEDELASTEPGEQELATTEPETVPLQKEVEADEAGFEEEVVEEDELATTEDLAYVRASPPQVVLISSVQPVAVAEECLSDDYASTEDPVPSGPESAWPYMALTEQDEEASLSAACEACQGDECNAVAATKADGDAKNQDIPDADNQEQSDVSGRGSDEELELRETVQNWLKHAQEDAYVCELPSRPLVNSQPHCSQGCGQTREAVSAGEIPWVADWDKFAPPPPQAGCLAAMVGPNGEPLPDIYTTSFLV